MCKLPNGPAIQPAASPEVLPVIPTIRPKSTGQPLTTDKPAGIAGLPLLFVALVFACFSLNAPAAGTPKSNVTRPATASGAGGEQQLTSQERIEQTNNMTPEQRNYERELLRRQTGNLSPEQRAEQRKEMRAHWEQMSPEERDQIRTRMKEHWKSMPKEQREERRKEMREHFKGMSPEVRQQFKSDMNMLDVTPPPTGDYPREKAIGVVNPAKG